MPGFGPHSAGAHGAGVDDALGGEGEPVTVDAAGTLAGGGTSFSHATHAHDTKANVTPSAPTRFIEARMQRPSVGLKPVGRGIEYAM
jgi:hypothetical protein